MADEDLQSTLRAVAEKFDLGEYELAAYLAVLEHGELTASEVAENADIPQPRVYDTVRSLSDRGLVELHESRPMTVVAVDPEEAFSGLESSFSALLEGLSARYTAPERDTEAVSLVKSQATIRRHFGRVVDGAEYELLLSLTPDLLRELREPLEAAVDRGVSIELVVTPAAEAPNADAYDYGAVATVARARRGITTPVLAVGDGEHSIYATQRAFRDDTDRYAVIFNRSALGFLVGGFFGMAIWTTADLELLGDEAPPDFPRRYATIRRCVKHVRATDRPVYATIEGRDIATGDRRVVRGRVATTHFTSDEEVATLVIETVDGETVSVGGRMAAYEDVEARTIEVDFDAPPA
ncbi:MAG: HTH-type sugar sensing transcriptional regulator TrmB [Halobacteriaceae archaeon]